MSQFLGAQTSLQNEEYVDIRADTSQQPYRYLTRIVPAGTCPKEVPYTCGWGEGGKNLSTQELRVGSGLTRLRGAIRKPAQLVGPTRFQKGNGNFESVAIGTTLRNGTNQVLRGSHRPSTELTGRAPFQQGQAPWIDFNTTAERGRNRYDYATQCTANYMLGFPPRTLPKEIEPFELGGITTRMGKDC